MHYYYAELIVMVFTRQIVFKRDPDQTEFMNIQKWWNTAIWFMTACIFSIKSLDQKMIHTISH